MDKKLTITLTKEELRKEILKQFLETHYIHFNELCNTVHETIIENIRKGSHDFSLSFKRPNDIRVCSVLKEYLTIQGYSYEVKTDSEGMPTGESLVILSDGLF